MKLTEKNYIERDVSWMAFNYRILAEAQREDIPLMERLNFLGIYSNNLDEFFRVRVATLNRIVELADKSSKDLRERSERALKTVNKLNSKYAQIFEDTTRKVTEALGEQHIHLVTENDLDEEQQQFVRMYCLQNLAGSLSPSWLSAVKALTASADDTIYLMVRLQHWKEDKKNPEKNYAIVELPVRQFGRFVQLPSRGEDHYIMYLDDVIRCALPYMFPGTNYNHFEAWSFKFNKDAEMEIESDIRGGMLQKIAKGVKSRKNGLPVRFKELLVSPNDMKRQLVALINQEIKNHDLGLPAGILAKLNHVTDEVIVKKIYEAASAGVKVQLLVRGNCSLVTDLPELGGNLRVNAIIDRYLEHSRILIFANGADLEHPEIIEEDGSHRNYKVFVGSADWMPRNLDHRIEVYTPVYDADIKREAKLIVELGMKNERGVFRSQEELYKHYNK